MSDLLQTKAHARAAELANAQSEEADVRRSEMRLTEAFVGGFITPNTYQVKQNELLERLAVLLKLRNEHQESEVALRSRIETTLSNARTVADLYRASDDLQRKALLRTVFSGIVLDHRGIVGFYLRTPFDSNEVTGATESSGQLAQLLMVAA